MKAKVSKIVFLPMVYGVMAGCMVTAALVLWFMTGVFKTDVAVTLLASLVLSAFAVCPAVRIAAWAYSNVRKYHNAEYYYDLGNGIAGNKAMAYFERRAVRAAHAWEKRRFWKESFGIAPAVYLFMVLRDGQWLADLWVLAVLLLLVLGIEVGLWTMLFTARKLCYDQYGNLKNI